MTKGIPCINWLWPGLCGHPEPVIIAMGWNYPPLELEVGAIPTKPAHSHCGRVKEILRWQPQLMMIMIVITDS